MTDARGALAGAGTPSPTSGVAHLRRATPDPETPRVEKPSGETPRKLRVEKPAGERRKKEGRKKEAGGGGEKVEGDDRVRTGRVTKKKGKGLVTPRKERPEGAGTESR